MMVRQTLVVALVLLVLCFVAARSPASASGGEAESRPSGDHINLAVIKGSINPASSSHLQRAIADSEVDGAEALIIELDTPGGLVSSTKDILQAMLNSKVPIVVYVAPRGAWAGSAGTFITIAGHVAAMAPGTSIGAAHPVGIGGSGKSPAKKDGDSENPGENERDYASEKAENLLSAFIGSIAKERHRNVEWAEKAVRESVAVGPDEALELKVIDLIAQDRDELLQKLEGREVTVAGKTRILHVKGLPVRLLEMSRTNRFLNVLASPDVAMLLIMIGLLGLYIEANTPGVGVPGIVGVVCLFLGGIALQILPFSWLGLALLLAGVGFFVAEVFVTSFGIFFALGVACFLIGGSMLFDMPEVSDLNVSFWKVLVPAVAAVALFGAVVVMTLGRSMRREQSAGTSELIGKEAVAVTALDPKGTVFVHGEHWMARSEDGPIAERENVEIVDVKGLTLTVRRASSSST